MPCHAPRRLPAPAQALLDGAVLDGPLLEASHPERPRDPEARVGDVDRERTASLLSHAAAAGYLRLDELEERLTRTWSATTGADLTLAEAGLPPALRRDRDRREAAAQARAAARAGLRPHIASYAAVMALLVAIWLVVGMTAGAWYPWPVWPALGWGIGLAGHVRAARAPAARAA